MKRILIVFDSCRYDTYMQANTKMLDENIGKPVKAYTLANITYPSMLLFMFSNRLPYTRDLKSDRFKSCLNFVPSLKRAGIDTHLLTDNPYLTKINAPIGGVAKHFKTYEVYNDTARVFRHANCKKLFQHAENLKLKDNFYLVLWFTETHMPYAFGSTRTKKFNIKKIRQYNNGKNSMRPQYLAYMHRRQKDACSYLAAHTWKFLKDKLDCEIIITADHGELFGEQHYYGHGVGTDDKVFEVPLVTNFKGKVGMPNV